MPLDIVLEDGEKKDLNKTDNLEESGEMQTENSPKVFFITKEFYSIPIACYLRY